MPRDEMSSWNPADVETWHRLVQKIVKFQCNLAEQDILLPATFNIFYSNKIQDFLKERGVCWCTHESASSYTLIVKAVLPLHDILSDFARDSFESWKKSMPQSIASCFSVVSQHCVKMQKKVDRTPPEELICTSAVIFTDPIMKKSKMATVVFLAGLLEDHAELNDMAQWFFDNKAQRVIVVYASEDRDELERTKALPESKYRIASLLQEFGNDRSKALLPELMGEIQTNVVPYTPISKDEAEMEQEISNQISLKVQTEDWVGPCKFWIEYVGSGNMMVSLPFPFSFYPLLTAQFRISRVWRRCPQPASSTLSIVTILFLAISVNTTKISTN